MRCASRQLQSASAAAAPLPVLRVAAFALAGLALQRLRQPAGHAPAEAPLPPPLPPPPEPPAEESASAGAGEEAACRFCFGGASDGELISPCACRGTQAHVHVSCLREWQRSALVSRGAREGVCRVCAAPFALPRPPLHATLREWFALRAADRLHIWTSVWTQILANTMLPLHEPRLGGARDVLMLLVAAEARVLTARELRRGRPLLRTLRNAALASDMLHSTTVLLWVAALGAACAGDALHACSRAAARRRATAAALLLTPVARLLTGAARALLLPVRAVLRVGEPLHRVVAFVERFPQYRL
jgi:hypothetical protein